MTSRASPIMSIAEHKRWICRKIPKRWVPSAIRTRGLSHLGSKGSTLSENHTTRPVQSLNFGVKLSDPGPTYQRDCIGGVLFENIISLSLVQAKLQMIIRMLHKISRYFPTRQASKWTGSIFNTRLSGSPSE